MEKSKKNIIPFVVAILLGIVSVITVNKYITSQTHETRTKEVGILAAKTPIPHGVVISLDQITTKAIPVTGGSEVNISVPLGKTPKALLPLIPESVISYSAIVASASIHLGKYKNP